MISFNIDLSDIQDLLGLEEVANEELRAAANGLAEATRAKIVELANERLHSRRNMFIEALSIMQIDSDTWVINLDKKAVWIDSGMSPHSMVEDLLKSPKAKRGKDGSAYLSVPFQHNAGKQNQTPAQQSLLATIKKELAKVGATPNGIETDRSGKAKMGLVRSLDINKAPLSTGALRIGRGPRGHVAQGPTGIPLLKNVRIYQKEIKTKSGESKVGRFVMTFRTVSSKDAGTDKWYHPGIEGVNLMEDGLNWALDQWANKIAPSIVAKIVAKIS